MELRKKLVKKLRDEYSTDELALAVVQVGSKVKGYDDKHSDVDLEVVVTEEKYDALAVNSQKIIHIEKYDLIFTTIDKLRQIKDSNKDEEHWNYQNSIILFDRTHTVQEILNEITQYAEASRIDRLTRYYCAYWENTLSSLSCIEHGNHWGARIYTALAIQGLIRLLFNFNHLWTPKLQWAF